MHKYVPGRDRPGRYFTTCDNCGAHFGNGSEAETECEECRDVVRLRTIALRLLAAPLTDMYGPRFSVCSRTLAERLASAGLIDDMVERIKRGEVAIPDVLPVPHGCDVHSQLQRGGESLYRALGNGSRRRWDTNASRR